MPLVLALEMISECEAIVVYIASPRTTGLHRETLSQNKTKQRQKQTNQQQTDCPIQMFFKRTLLKMLFLKNIEQLEMVFKELCYH